MAITMTRNNAANISGSPTTLSGLSRASFTGTRHAAPAPVLSRLSAHELDDIGICRGDIDAICSGRR